MAYPAMCVDSKTYFKDTLTGCFYSMDVLAYPDQNDRKMQVIEITFNREPFMNLTDLSDEDDTRLIQRFLYFNSRLKRIKVTCDPSRPYDADFAMKEDASTIIIDKLFIDKTLDIPVRSYILKDLEDRDNFFSLISDSKRYGTLIRNEEETTRIEAEPSMRKWTDTDKKFLRTAISVMNIFRDVIYIEMELAQKPLYSD